MTRKTPFEHEVKPHTRAGVPVGKYKRGKGKQRQKEPSSMRLKSSKHPSFNVSFFFSEGNETYNTSGTPTSALRSAVSRIQRPEVPEHAQVRQIR